MGPTTNSLLVRAPSPLAAPAPLYNGVFVGGKSYYAPNTPAKAAVTSAPAATPGAASAPSGAQPGVATTSVGYSGSTAPAAPTAAQTSPLLASLGSLDSVLGNRLTQAQGDYSKAIAGYDAQDALDKQAHDQNVQQNEQDYTAGDQAALLNAADAATGLRGVLGSLGALAGSGSDVVRRLVGNAANSDLGAARGTFNNNAQTLSNDFAQTTQQEAQRRADADAILANAKQNANADVLNSRQTILEQLANLYGPNSSQGDTYASEAAALAPQIAATSKATVAPYAAASSLYTPSTLASYLSGTKNEAVSTTGGNNTPINSPAYSGGASKKDTLAGVA